MKAGKEPVMGKLNTQSVMKRAHRIVPCPRLVARNSPGVSEPWSCWLAKGLESEVSRIVRNSDAILLNELAYYGCSVPIQSGSSDDASCHIQRCIGLVRLEYDTRGSAEEETRKTQS